MRAGFIAARGGYSLIEVLLALLLLMILVQVIGASLVTVLSVEQQASEARELSDVSQILVNMPPGVSEAETMRGSRIRIGIISRSPSVEERM